MHSLEVENMQCFKTVIKNLLWIKSKRVEYLKLDVEEMELHLTIKELKAKKNELKEIEDAKKEAKPQKEKFLGVVVI